ncbi:methionine/alanine import family NSS transporter small subunit [Bacillus salipaludis]|uniref:Methionine/alanine import family NSS transporter small subunit n=1 Tax=Bacillus salipaludis TaxID=2547811 RepID=A0ABW8RFB1_9BACI
MSGSALTMMVIGMVIIWGGLAASILNVVRVSRKKS